MAFVITQPCIGVKDTACVDSCPTDAIHAYADSPQFYIDPVACIDCGACEPVCPVKAIFPLDQVPADQKSFISINTDFFKAFDKSKSAANNRGEKKGKAEETKVETQAQEKIPGEGETQKEMAWIEKEGWEALWEAHKKEMEDPIERQKRYGRVRSVFELSDRYILRFFLPEKTPNHMFVYKYDLPVDMPPYVVTAKLEGSLGKVYGQLKDPRLVKLCGFANSFPDRFYVEYPFPKPVSSVSVVVQSEHVVDVVAIKAVPAQKAA